jgi:hypothetical protein
MKVFRDARAAIPNPDKRLSGDIAGYQAKDKGNARDKILNLFSP